MPTFYWREFLKEWSKALIGAEEYKHYVENLPSQAVKSSWLGFAEASEAQILEAETRLETQFPPSYREFLLTTNGWRTATQFILNLWPAQEVEWFRTRHTEDWIEPWLEGAELQRTQTKSEQVFFPTPDEQYFVYGQSQNVSAIREEYLFSMLEISDVGNSAVFLLNPEVVTEEKEWEAWFFAPWLPGARRYRSFWDMMQEEYKIFAQSLH